MSGLKISSCKEIHTLLAEIDTTVNWLFRVQVEKNETLCL